MASPLISVTCKAARQAWSPGQVLSQRLGTKQQRGFLGLKSPEGRQGCKGCLTSLLPGVGETLLPGGLRAGGWRPEIPGTLPPGRAGCSFFQCWSCSPWVFLPPTALWHLTFSSGCCVLCKRYLGLEVWKGDFPP